MEILNIRAIIYGALILFLLYILFGHTPGSGGGHKGHGDKHGGGHGGAKHGDKKDAHKKH